MRRFTLWRRDARIHRSKYFSIGRHVAMTNRSERFEALYREHEQWLLCYLQKQWKLPVHTAEDISQKVWLNVHASLDSFDGAKARAWLSKISGNEVASLFRTKKSKMMLQAVSTDALPAGYDSLGVTGERDASPGSGMERAERLDQFNDCIGVLSEETGTVLRQILSGADYGDLAASMQTTKQRLYKLVHGAKQAIKQCMEAKGW